MKLTDKLKLLESSLNNARIANERLRHELDEAYRMLRECKEG